MNIETSLTGPGRTSIKKRLLDRFGKAKAIVGPGWKDALAASEPFFDTRTGEAYMHSVAQAYSDPRRGDADQIELVTITLEKVAGIQPKKVA